MEISEMDLWRLIMIVDWFNTYKIFIILFLIVNIVVIAMYGVDKWKAIHHKWRIPEATLISAAFFGVVGALLGMIVFHHKIRKPKFYISVPLIMILEVASVVYVFR